MINEHFCDKEHILTFWSVEICYVLSSKPVYVYMNYYKTNSGTVQCIRP